MEFLVYDNENPKRAPFRVSKRWLDAMTNEPRWVVLEQDDTGAAIMPEPVEPVDVPEQWWEPIDLTGNTTTITNAVNECEDSPALEDALVREIEGNSRKGVISAIEKKLANLATP